MSPNGDSVELIVSGDAMLGRGVDAVMQTAGPAYPFEPLAAQTRAADLFFTNLECAITPKDRTYSGPPKAFYFRAGPVAADALAFAGVDLVSLANNHALDADFDGLLDTLAALDEKGIRHAGAGRDLADAGRMAVVATKGMRIGVLAFCDHQPDFAAADDRPGVRYVELADPAAYDALLDEVAAHSSLVDHLVVSFHWQPNWVPRVHPAYRALAGHLVAAGASVVWGHSPHHFQGVEWFDGRPAIYSSGGLVDDYALEPNFRNDRQLLFRVTLSAERVERVVASPIELEFARTVPARSAARRWIARRFADLCAEVGSRVEAAGEGLAVVPGVD